MNREKPKKMREKRDFLRKTIRIYTKYVKIAKICNVDKIFLALSKYLKILYKVPHILFIVAIPTSVIKQEPLFFYKLFSEYFFLKTILFKIRMSSFYTIYYKNFQVTIISPLTHCHDILFIWLEKLQLTVRFVTHLYLVRYNTAATKHSCLAMYTRFKNNQNETLMNAFSVTKPVNLLNFTTWLINLKYVL
ncbi:hypothetical protein AGLY_013037 [Aphis glycines]|uniref:Uncharacterized protein n=1 Tax=Aphis glycines TaxID=307491 RepID=A0A6G0T866_APHGL|nr:hypothetical protein AGLY_013037 [Aphis glycines]